MTIYTFNLLVGYEPNGVDVAQASRALMLRELNAPAKFVFTTWPQPYKLDYYLSLGHRYEEFLHAYVCFTDQDGYIHGLPVPFLGQPSSAVVGPATFAKKFGAPVVPIFASRKPEGGHIVHILPALHYIDTGDEDADMYRLTEECVRVTEDFIREHPDEWLWFQHRWMTKMDQIIDYDKKVAARERAHEK